MHLLIKSLWLQTQMLRAIDKAVLRRNDETRKFVFKTPFSNTEQIYYMKLWVKISFLMK